MQKRPLAVVTMAYNESTMLPLWLRHYDRQLGAENCYVLDHGSDDGSTMAIPANRIRLPRTPLDEWARVNTIRDFCASLFIGFKCVLFTDTDELVVADPDVASSLSDYIASRDVPPVLDLFGADVRHVEGEAPIDLQRPISLQRGYIRSISSLCKATLISKRTDWHIGFHCVVHHHRPKFGDLFLFHLAHCDNDILFERQKKRNAAAPISIPDSHHAIPPSEFRDHIKTELAGLTRRRIQLRAGENLFETTKRLFADAIERKSWAQAPDLWQLPERFVGTF